MGDEINLSSNDGCPGRERSERSSTARVWGPGIFEETVSSTARAKHPIVQGLPTIFEENISTTGKDLKVFWCKNFCGLIYLSNSFILS